MSSNPNLPLEVLSWLAPILSLVEGMGTLRYRSSLLWGLGRHAAGKREVLWLGSKYPYHSEIVIDEARRSVAQQDTTALWRGDGCYPVAWNILDPDLPLHLPAIFDYLACRYLEWSGDRVAVRSGRMEEFHQVALIFPLGHVLHHFRARALVQGYLNREYREDWQNLTTRLHTANTSLTSVVARGLYEGHLHLGGMTSAEEMWPEHLLYGANRTLRQTRKPEREQLLTRVSRLVMRLAVVGLVLHHRWSAVRNLGTGPMSPDIGVVHLDALLGKLDAICAEPYWKVAGLRVFALEKAVSDVVGATFEICFRLPGGWLGPRDIEFAKYLLAPARLLLDRRYRFGTLLRQNPTPAQRRRRAVDWLNLKLHQAVLELPSGRRRLWQEGGDREGSVETDRGPATAIERYLNRVFFRYLVLHTYHHQLGTQCGIRTGLARFRRYFSASQRQPVDCESRAQAAVLFGEILAEGHLKVIEGRVSPSSGGAKTILPWLLGFDDARTQIQRFPDQSNPRAAKADLDFGLVIHFLKKPEGRDRDCQTSRGTLFPDTDRYLKNRFRVRKESLNLFRFLSRPDPQVPFVVGIDAANLELEVPPEVFAPAFRFLREYPIDLKGGSLLRWTLVEKRNLVRLLKGRRLGMTYHVGEDFRHLLSGLRAVHEAVEFLAARSGDRVGHAIALGVNAESWAELLAFQVLVPRQELLDNLIWILHFLGPGHVLLGELGIEEGIQKQASYIYGRRYEELSPSALDLHHSWMLRQVDPEFLDAQGDPTFREALATSAERSRWMQVQREVFEKLSENRIKRRAFLFYQYYLYDRKVRRRGAELATIHLDRRWLQVCTEVQAKLRRLLHARHIVVEVNPSSNCAVGPIARLKDHHIFRLARDCEGAPRLATTVNSDDPGVFQTSLAQEFYLLGEELLAQNVDGTEVVTWLEELRRNGADYSFVTPLSKADPEGKEAVLAELRRLYGGYSSFCDRWFKE